MKRLIIIAGIALTAMGAQAQRIKEGRVPDAVKTAFKHLYPTVTAVDWDKEKPNYEANFTVEGVERSVVFDAMGNLMATEIDIPVSQLPLAARNYLVKHFKTSQIKGASRMVDSVGAVSYEADVPGPDPVFDASGAMVRTDKD
jgi:hypothetical protein